MLARVTRDGTICAAKNNTFGYFDGTNPVTVSSPNYGYWHNAKMGISSRVKNNIFAKENTKLSRTKLYNSCLVFFTWTLSMSQSSIVLVLNDLYDIYILLYIRSIRAMNYPLLKTQYLYFSDDYTSVGPELININTFLSKNIISTCSGFCNSDWLAVFIRNCRNWS